MTRQHEIKEHLKSLQDISEIMGAMKSLSLMETQKLARCLSHQHRVVQSIQTAGLDFLSAYSELLIAPQSSFCVFIVIGSERGFCGDFNQKLIDVFTEHTSQFPMQNRKLILIGSKLFNGLETLPQIEATLDGPAVGQEVEAVISQLLDTLTMIDRQYGPYSLTVVHHAHELKEVQLTVVLPPFQHFDFKSVSHADPPLLNLSKETFFQALVDHYLFAVLFEMFYSSLMAEHYRRAQHLESAIQRLEERTDALNKKRNSLRQEEITEELEVIMLNAGVLDKV